MKETLLIVFMLTGMIKIPGPDFWKTQQENQFAGTWLAKEMNNSAISLYKQEDGRWYAKILLSDDTNLKNFIIFSGGIYSAESKTIKGILRRKDSTMKIDATLSMVEKNQLKIVGTKFFISKTFLWKRL